MRIAAHAALTAAGVRPGAVTRSVEMHDPLWIEDCGSVVMAALLVLSIAGLVALARWIGGDRDWYVQRARDNPRRTLARRRSTAKVSAAAR
jgi:hypothetical protein